LRVLVAHEPGNEYEREFARTAAPSLSEYRLSQLEQRVERNEQRMETLATKADVREIKEKIDIASATQDDRRFEWWKVIVAGAFSAALVFIAQLAANALVQPHH
jgi:hypothetical protein